MISGCGLVAEAQSEEVGHDIIQCNITWPHAYCIVYFQVQSTRSAYPCIHMDIEWTHAWIATV